MIFSSLVLFLSNIDLTIETFSLPFPKVCSLDLIIDDLKVLLRTRVLKELEPFLEFSTQYQALITTHYYYIILQHTIQVGNYYYYYDYYHYSTNMITY